MDEVEPVELQQFVDAQANGTYERALAEVRAGLKTSHWMWFVFPQLAGLGRSAISERFGIGDVGEARAYLAHPVLGARLRDCARAAASIEPGHIEQVFGSDAKKLRSSMTLFELADPGEPAFAEVLDKHFSGRRDQTTLDKLR